MASRSSAAPLMPDFNSWISDLNLSSPAVLEQKVDEICSGIEDRLNPKNAIEYIKVMQSHLLLEVWSQIRIFIIEQYQKNEFFSNAQLIKLNKNQKPTKKRSKKKTAQPTLSYAGSISMRSAKTHIQIAPSSYLLLLWKNRQNQMNIQLNQDESKTPHNADTAAGLPPHVLVQVDTPTMTKNKFDSIWNITLSLNEKSYELIKENRHMFGKESDLHVVPIKNLIYLQRDYDAVKCVDAMPLSRYIMGKEHLINRRKNKKSLFDHVKNHGLVKKYFGSRLNESQFMALRESLIKPLTLIHGPPGTGKTKFALLPILKCAYLALQVQFDAANRTSVSKLMGGKHRNILKAIDKRWKVARIGVFAGSNQAVDEIILSIFALNENHATHALYSDIPIARMGNSYNMDPNVAKHKEMNINSMIDYYLAFKWDKQSRREVYDWKPKLKQRVNAIQSELKRIEIDLSQAFNSKILDDKSWEKVKILFNKSRPLSLELQCLNKVEAIRYPNQAQRKLLPVLMNSSEVLFSTANYLGRCMISPRNKTLKVYRFDFSLFDECCQMRETETLIALQHCWRAVFIGDPKQLQATILYHGKYRSLLLNSLFIRCEKYIKPIMLTEQYRMNEEISLFPSKQFYGGKLRNAPQCKRIKSFHMDKSNIFKPYLLFDVVGREEKRSNSVINLEEIKCIQTLIHNLQQNETYLAEIDSIGIITPYLAHKNLIDATLREDGTKGYLLHNHRINIECVTVDEFQGSERDIIIFSCVRSNVQNNIGFLNDVSRLNVAITRAKYALWIIGNAKCLKSADQTWNALVEDVVARNLLIDYTSIDIHS
eukprot:226117_1